MLLLENSFSASLNPNWVLKIIILWLVSDFIGFEKKTK